MSDTIIKMTGGVIRQQKNTILKNVNIEIKSGEFIYLIGKVGSGKSSFLKTLYAELPLEYGNAEIVGFKLKKIRKSQIPLLRRKCGIVFQDFKLLIDRNVYDNLEFVLRATGWRNKKDIRERIENVLTKVGMQDKQNQMPHQLSGGEQQRIVLARALLNAPPLILADEPTGNIDPETSYQLVELLKEICDTGKTIIIATHQYDLIKKYPGRILCCENGELIEKTPANSCDCSNTPGGQATEELVTESQPPLSMATATEETVVPPVTEIIPDTPEKETSPEIPAETPVASPEPLCMEQQEDILSLIGKLDYPEISAFDYELEHLPEIEPGEKEKTEQKTEEANIPAEMEETQEEGQIDIFPVADEKENENDEEKRKKNIPPVMDLELID